MKKKFTKFWIAIVGLLLGTVQINAQVSGNTITFSSTYTYATGEKLNSGTSSEVTITSNKASQTSQSGGCGASVGSKPMNGLSSNGDWIQFEVTGSNVLSSVSISISANSSTAGTCDYFYYNASGTQLSTGKCNLPDYSKDCNSFSETPPVGAKSLKLVRNGATIRIYQATIITKSITPTITPTPISLNFSSIGIGSTDTRTLNISGAALEDDITISYPSGFSGPLTITKVDAEATGGKNITVEFDPESTIKSWSGNITLNSTNATPVNIPVTAVSTSIPHVLAVVANPAEIATMTGSGEYAEDAEVVVGYNTVTRGYVFDHWDATVIGGKFTMPATATTLTGYFVSAPTYSLTLAVDGGCTTTAVAVTSGPAQIEGKYYPGDQITIKATPCEGYRFVSWNDGNTNAQRTITIENENVTYTASFAERMGIPTANVSSLTPVSTTISWNDVEADSYSVEVTKLVKSWNFTGTWTISIANADDNLVADGTTRFNYKNATTGEELKFANGNIIPDVAGLKFTAGATDKLRLGYGTGLVYLNGSNIKVEIPCAMGDLVTVVALSSSTNQTNRGFTVGGNRYKNTSEDINSSGILTTPNVDGVWAYTPSTGNSVTFTTAGGGMNIKSIKVEKIANSSSDLTESSKVITSLDPDTEYNYVVTAIRGSEKEIYTSTFTTTQLADYHEYGLTISTSNSDHGSAVRNTVPHFTYQSKEYFIKGTQVELAAQANSGYEFKRWEVAELKSIIGDQFTDNPLTLTLDDNFNISEIKAIFDTATGIYTPAASSEIVSVKYYTLTGIEVNATAAKGIVIAKTTYVDGSVTTSKIVK